jgi:N-methylhydantoinase A
MSGVIGIDIGGTFTDCVYIDADGNVHMDKAFTTPERPADGILQAVANIAGTLRADRAEILRGLGAMSVGTTSALNRLVSRKGVSVGLITTLGHEDALIIGRVSQKTDGLGERERSDMLAWDKASPIVSRSLIRGVSERVDYKGAIICPLDESAVVAAAEQLLAAGAESIAICFLWSFRNAQHERRARELILKRHPDVDVAISSEVAPVLGEYERTATTVINAYLMPGARHDFSTLARELAGAGLTVDPLLMQSTGGVTDAGSAAARPAYLLASGPVGGVSGSLSVGKLTGIDNIVTTDMGGTSFDVGIVVKGTPQLARVPIYDRYRLLVPAVSVVSIGAGGGSIARVAPATKTLHVGPESAGSRPGPACYGLGGTDPTVTDADLILGRISADRFFHGRKVLDLEAARRAMRERVGEPLGISDVEAAEGIIEIVDARMGDLIRKTTIERGYDPRAFTILAFGGAGAVHVGGYGRDAGAPRAMVPAAASVFSAFGIACSDVRRDYSLSDPQALPCPIDRLEGIFARLRETAASEIAAEVLSRSDIVYSVDMRFRYQARLVRVLLSGVPHSEEDLERAVQQFLVAYEDLFGKGSANREVGVEMVTFHLSAVTPVSRPEMRWGASRVGGRPRSLGTRDVRFARSWVKTPIYGLEDLPAATRLEGPALLEGAITTVVVHPGQVATTDEFANVMLEFPAAPDPTREGRS